VSALCVSIHDVAPRTLEACKAIADAVEQVDPAVRLTLLVVPRYHNDASVPPEYVRWIEARLARGDELALHGLTHVDDSPRSAGIYGRARRSFYTAGEGEFAALSHEEARERITAGCEWFAQRGWPVAGFVAPAWLTSRGTWEALQDFDFLYTTTLARFWLLRRGAAAPSGLRAPCVVYSTRSAWRRIASRAWNTALVSASARSPLVRFGFHPADAGYPGVMAHACALLHTLAAERTAVTKAAFARSLG
jgi:predicted deacetylase